MKVSAKQYDHVLIWIPSLSTHYDLVFVKNLKESESINLKIVILEYSSTYPLEIVPYKSMSTISNQSVLIAPFI